MSLFRIGFCLVEDKGRVGWRKVVKWSLMSFIMTPEVKDKFLELVKIWSIKEILSLKIRVALLIVWMNPYCIAFSMRLEAAGVRLSLRRLMLESVKIKESWLDRDSSDIK